ncbi:MAG: hypothetical protein ACSW8C_00605 [bacterium]
MEDLMQGPYTFSIPQADFLSDWECNGTLEELLLNDAADINFSLKVLCWIGKLIVDHGPEMTSRDLHPKKIYILTTNGNVNITFIPYTTPIPESPGNQESGIMNTAENPRVAFAYLMFYIMFPQTREKFDRGAIRITKKHFCVFNREIENFVPTCPYFIENPHHLTNNWDFFVPFELCAVSLFYEVITVKEAVRYLENCGMFNIYFGLLKASVESFTMDGRFQAREELGGLEAILGAELLDLARKVFQKWFSLSKLLYCLENPRGISLYEDRFMKLFDCEENSKEAFEIAVETLYEMCCIDRKIEISLSTFEKLRELFKRTKGIGKESKERSGALRTKRTRH